MTVTLTTDPRSPWAVTRGVRVLRTFASREDAELYSVMLTPSVERLEQVTRRDAVRFRTDAGCLAERVGRRVHCLSHDVWSDEECTAVAS